MREISTNAEPNPVQRREQTSKGQLHLIRRAALATDDFELGDGSELDLDDPDVGYRLQVVSPRS